MQSEILCPKKHCRAPMHVGTDGAGRVVFTCEPCARNARGLCRDCPARLVYKSPRGRGAMKRCAECRRRLDRAAHRARYHLTRTRQLEYQRHHRQQPEIRARRLAYCAEWRRRHPYVPDDFDRAYKRTYMRAYRQDPVTRDRINAQRRAKYRARRMAA